MLDLPCPHCGEPWDNDELHGSESLDYKAAFEAFKTYGCGAMDSVYNGDLARVCDAAPIFTETHMEALRQGWSEAEYAEDIASWMDMVDAIGPDGAGW